MKTQHLFFFSKRWLIGVLVLALSGAVTAPLEAQDPMGSASQAANGSSQFDMQQRMKLLRRKRLKEFLQTHSDASGVPRQDLWLQGIEHFKHMEVTTSITLQPSFRALQAETFTLQWQQIGPQPLIDDAYPLYPFSGQVTDIAIDPRGTTDRWIYIATNDGGIWKTTDGGTTWLPKTDFMPSNSMGAVALDPDNPSIVYAGTGNAFNNGFFKAIGVYRSLDGGDTWMIPAGSSLFSEKFVNGVFVPGKTINRIVVPANQHRLLVGTNAGLFQSSNEGVTYGSNVPAFDDQQPILNGDITDIDVDPEASNIAYACVNGVGVFTLVDVGFGYRVLRQNFPEQPLPGLGYLSFAQSTKPTANTMYLNVQVGDQAKLFRSFERGFDWQDLGNIGFVQVGYDQTIGVDPQDASRVYAGLVPFYRSDNSGENFATKGSDAVHADHHALVFSPSSHTQGANSPTRIWVGTDGGVYSSTDAGDRWSDLNNTIATNLFRAIDIGRGDGSVVAIGPNRGFTYGGAQDNGTSEHWPNFPGNTWHEAPEAYGDGQRTIVDPTNPMRAYSFVGVPFSFQRTTDGGRSWVGGTFNGEPSAGEPLAVDPKNISIIYLSGGNFLVRSTDMGETSKLIYAFPEGTGIIQAVSLSQNNPSVMWVGMSNGSVQRSTNLLDANGNPNDNPTFTPHMVNGAPAGFAVGNPQGIAIDPTNDNEAVVVYEGFTECQGHAFRVRTNDNGVFLNNDTNITGNLPDLPLHAVVFDSNPDPVTGQLPIIVASDAGVLRTTDAGPNGAHWQVFGTSLPIVDCTSLAIDSSINPALLRVGSYGRSAFELKTSGGPAPVADLSITKTGSPDPVTAGNNLTYTVTVTNNGPDIATSVTVTDNLPAETTFVSCSSTGGGVCGDSCNNRTVTFASLASGGSETITFVATVNCSVTDGTVISNTAKVSSSTSDPNTNNNSATATTTVSNPPPTITGASANPSVLRPPNHRLVDVTVNYNVTDNCPLPPNSCTLSVTSNEPVNGSGDGDTSPDWVILDAHHVQLRAERAGKGNGRIYTITITCIDSGGNSSSKSVTVSVPHDQGRR